MPMRDGLAFYRVITRNMYSIDLILCSIYLIDLFQ